MSILLKRFHDQKEAMWQELSKEIDAAIIPGKGFLKFKHDKLVARHKEWSITVQSFKRRKKPTKTHIRALYVNRDGFEFRIYRRNLLSHISKAFGLEDIEIGHPEFDKQFIIQGNSPKKLRKLFDNEVIRQIISWQPEILLWNEVDPAWSRQEIPQGYSELCFSVDGVITDLQQMRDLYDLFATMLNHLCEIGSAYESSPY